MNAAIKETSAAKPNYGLSRAWHAQIELGYSYKPPQTKLTRMAFKGPLRVQRPFYPEGSRCHSYLLHPPGGMVSGDRIDIDVSVDCNADALVTTPSAGKIYGADSANVVQTQAVSLTVNEGASLEFLPQENIVFNGANAELSTSIEMHSNSKLLFWDAVSFGRPHGGFHFERGKLQQTIKVKIDDRIVLHEGFETDDQLRILQSNVGLMGHIHMASFYIASPSQQTEYEDWLNALRQVLPKASSTLKLAATERSGLIIVRGLADDIEVLRNALIKVWKAARPLVLGEQPTVPRIWLT